LSAKRLTFVLLHISNKFFNIFTYKKSIYKSIKYIIKSHRKSTENIDLRSDILKFYINFFAICFADVYKTK